jgi:NADPH:quinone reductase-like Zn-dependent oxidoreductase
MRMEAIVYTRYGPPDVLELRQVDKPSPGENEILVRVRAASVNPADWHIMRGLPYVVRLDRGLRRPGFTRLGIDVAGVVEAVGRNVTRFQPGDEVFGASRGSFAEYVCTQGKALVLKPAGLSFEEAAALPVAAFTALQGLRDHGQIQPGQRVLVNGAAGGVGTLAVQVARAFGAEVTGVCSTRNLELVRSLGADRVIDYTQENFTRSGQRYDLLLDCVGNHSLPACRSALSPSGTYVMVAGSLANILRVALFARFMSHKLVFFVAKTNRADLETMIELIGAGKVKPVIDRRFALQEVPEAMRYVGTGRARGKVVITTG